jgi:cell division protein FtsB
VDFNYGTNRNSSTETGIGSDRLRKAIERNRARQDRRSQRDSKSSDTIETTASSGGSQTVFDWTPPPRRDPPPVNPRKASSTVLVPTRKTVARADSFEFTEEPPRASKKSAASVAYPVRSRATTRKVAKSSRKKRAIKGLGLKLAWAFSALMFVRLIFSGGGVIDYYSKTNLANGRQNELARIEKENRELIREIELIKNGHSHQKRLVREHLGFIASDEFLILFAKESGENSI